MSFEDVQRVKDVLEGKDERVKPWQQAKLAELIRRRMQEESAGVSGDSIQGAVLHRRIQELAWLVFDKPESEKPESGSAIGLVEEGTALADPKIAHCFNSTIIHQPENFSNRVSNSESPYTCRSVPITEAIDLCQLKMMQKSTAKVLRSTPVEHSVDLTASAGDALPRFSSSMSSSARSSSATSSSAMSVATGAGQSSPLSFLSVATMSPSVLRPSPMTPTRKTTT